MSAPHMHVVASNGDPLDSVPAPYFTPTEHLLHVADVLRAVLEIYKGHDLSKMTHGDAYQLVEHANRYAQCSAYVMAFQRRNWGIDYGEGYDSEQTLSCVRADVGLYDSARGGPFEYPAASPETASPVEYAKALADGAESDLAGWFDDLSGKPTRDTASTFSGVAS